MLINAERSFADVSNDILCKVLAEYYSNFHSFVEAIFLSTPAQSMGNIYESINAY